MNMEGTGKGQTLIHEFLRYSILNICGMIGLSCYILADTFFVSKGLGANGLAALNLAIPIYSFVHGSGLMLGMGGATKFSIFRYQGKTQKAQELCSGMVFLAIGFSAVFMGTGVGFAGKLTEILGADQEVFAMTKTYLRVILLFSPAFMLNDCLICLVRNDGSPQLSMTAMLAGSFSNIVMDYVLIFPLHMGILGAVLATGIAPVISMGVLSRHWKKKENHIRIRRIKVPFSQIYTILSLGVPSLIIEVASGVVMIVFNAVILRLQGNTGVAAYGVIANLSLVVTSIYTGIAQGMQPVISRFYGCGDRGSIRKIFRYGIVMMLMISAGIYAVFILRANPIVGIFNSEQNPELQSIAVIGMKLYFSAIAFAGFNILLSTYFTSTEKALPAQIISLARGFFVIIPVTLLLAFCFGMTGVWLAYPAAEGLVVLIGLWLNLHAPGIPELMS